MQTRRIISSPMMWILPFLILASGCNSAPRVRTQQASAIDRTEQAVHFSVELLLENPHDEDIPLDQYEYTFTVDKLGSFTGIWSALRTLPPGSSAKVTVPATIRIDPEARPIPLPGATWQWTMTGQVRYEAIGLLGNILFDVGIRRPAQGFHGTGNLTLFDATAKATPTSGMALPTATTGKLVILEDSLPPTH